MRPSPEEAIRDVVHRVWSGDPDGRTVLRFYLGVGAIRANSILGAPGAFTTLLHILASRPSGHACVCELLSWGADPLAPDALGQPAAGVAVDLRTVATLVAAGGPLGVVRTMDAALHVMRMRLAPVYLAGRTLRLLAEAGVVDRELVAAVLHLAAGEEAIHHMLQTRPRKKAPRMRRRAQGMAGERRARFEYGQ
jgi:hypothetical protein